MMNAIIGSAVIVSAMIVGLMNTCHASCANTASSIAGRVIAMYSQYQTGFVGMSIPSPRFISGIAMMSMRKSHSNMLGMMSV